MAGPLTKAGPMVISTLEMARAQDALEASLVDLDQAALHAPSRCRGWTRAHVLAHVARNADGMVNLATWAQDGEVVPMYASLADREADIAAGVDVPVDDLRADVAASNRRVLAAFGALEGRVAVDPAFAAVVVRLGADAVNGRPTPVRDLPFLRLQEVVVHHHDLDLGLRARDWPREYVQEALPRVAAMMATRIDAMPTLVAQDDDVVRQVTPDGADVRVEGPGASILVWLLGRATTADLEALDVSGGSLPNLPDY